MIKISKIYSLLLCLSVSASGYAQYSLRVERFKETDNFIVSINNPIGSKVNLLIKNKEDKTLWQESVMFVEKIKKVLFLGSLHPGEYKVEIFNGHEFQTSNIQVTGIDKTIHNENGKTLIVGFSKTKTDNNGVDIIIQNKLNKSVSLKLYKEQKLLTEENLGAEELIKKTIKIPGNEKGDYLIKVGSRENIYQYKFSL